MPARPGPWTCALQDVCHLPRGRLAERVRPRSEFDIDTLDHERLLVSCSRMLWRAIKALRAWPSIRTTLAATRSEYAIASGVKRPW